MVSAWSIGKSQRSTEWKSGSSYVPGPGAYNQEKQPRQQPPQWKIGTSVRTDLLPSNTPGPGAYEIKSKLANESNKYSLTGKTFYDPQSMRTPGPGAYEPSVNYCYEKPPAFSMGFKNSGSEASLQVPGPGAYDHKAEIEKKPISFPKSNRNNLYSSNNTPGPGAYDAQRPDTAAPQHGFGSSTRDDWLTNKTPGPGAYNTTTTIDNSQGFSLVSRKHYGEQIEAAKVPGPGAYNINFQNRLSSPQYRIGTEQRGKIDRERLGTPGPGTYSSQALFTHPSSPAYKLGTDVRKPLNGDEKTPGPGTYQHKDTLDGQKVSMKGSFKIDPIQREQMAIPGPGTYSNVLYRPSSASNGIIIGTSQRNDFNQTQNVPGPGMYEIDQQNKGPKWGFGSSVRPSTAKQPTPGPGHYDLQATIPDVPKYLLNNFSTID